MELNIGTNIKRLRLAKGYTQEQLAELLCVSGAAVSKWEAKNTYPDITLLLPLAEIFGVGVEALLGYDEAAAEAEAEQCLASYRALRGNGRLEEASAVLAQARRAHPQHYRIMHAYLWDRAGGKAGNCAETLLEHREEFVGICDCILNGCRDENLRIDALNMKAKLLFAQGDIDGALSLLSQLPNWGYSAEQKTEQLFAKDTPEYRYWNKRNGYALLELAANKLARSVYYDDTRPLQDRQAVMERMGDALLGLCGEAGLSCFCIAARMLYAVLSERLAADGAAVGDVIRVRKKEFAACERMTALAADEAALRDSLVQTYGTEDIRSWLVNWLLQTEHASLAALRREPAYMELLAQERERLSPS